jgi:hypothetical protein
VPRLQGRRDPSAIALSNMKHTLVRLLLAASGTGLLTLLIMAMAMATSAETVRPDRIARRQLNPAKL